MCSGVNVFLYFRKLKQGIEGRLYIIPRRVWGSLSLGQFIDISAVKCIYIQWDKSDQFRSKCATKHVLNDYDFGGLFRFQINIRYCAPVLYVLCVIIPSNIFGAFWRPDVGGFIC